MPNEPLDREQVWQDWKAAFNVVRARYPEHLSLEDYPRVMEEMKAMAKAFAVSHPGVIFQDWDPHDETFERYRNIAKDLEKAKGLGELRP